MYIELNQGLGNLKFGSTIDEAIDLFGKPSSVETIGEDLEMKTTLLHYENKGFSLFFDYEMIYNDHTDKPWEGVEPFSQIDDKETLTCIDINNDEVTLFGEKIIGKSSKEIINLMVSNNITNPTMDNEEWGEKRISFEDYSIDFFFVEDKLISVNFGK